LSVNCTSSYFERVRHVQHVHSNRGLHGPKKYRCIGVTVHAGIDNNLSVKCCLYWYLTDNCYALKRKRNILFQFHTRLCQQCLSAVFVIFLFGSQCSEASHLMDEKKDSYGIQDAVLSQGKPRDACRCKFRYVSKFTVASRGFHCDSNAFELNNRITQNKGVKYIYLLPLSSF